MSLMLDEHFARIVHSCDQAATHSQSNFADLKINELIQRVE